MKKNYISPKTNVFNVIEEQIIASSVLSVSVGDGSVDETGVLGRENNSISNSSLWDQGW